MIVDLPNTTTSRVSKRLVKMREEGGVVALGRVLTLVIAAQPGTEEQAIEAANDASREHPMRVIVVVTDPATQASAVPRLDAEIRVGGDAGASDVIVLRAYGAAASDEEGLVTGLLLPDAPIVTWWPGAAPKKPGDAALGQFAHRRITDASTATDPQAALHELSHNYTPGDADYAWTRLTTWRAQLAAVLDQPPYEPVTRVHVTGSLDSPSTTLLTVWLQQQLGAPGTCELTTDPAATQGIHAVRLERASGTIELRRDAQGVATLTQPGQPVHTVALPRRSLRDCLADELRRLQPDEVYGSVITVGLPTLAHRAPHDTRSTGTAYGTEEVRS